MDELIEARNAQQLKQKLHATYSVEYDFMESKYNVHGESVLDRGQKVEITRVANLHNGCNAIHVPVDDVHPHNLKRWAGVNDALGLAYSGMDYMTEDIGTTDGYIIDVNTNPGMEGVKFGLGRPLAKREVVTWFPLGPANRRTISEVPCAEDMQFGFGSQSDESRAEAMDVPEAFFKGKARSGKCYCEGHTKNWWFPKRYKHASRRKKYDSHGPISIMTAMLSEKVSTMWDTRSVPAKARTYHKIPPQEALLLPPVPQIRVACTKMELVRGKLANRTYIDQTLSKHGLVPWSATVPIQLMGDYSKCLRDVDGMLVKNALTTSTKVPYPLVAKPVSGAMGQGVHTGLDNAEMLCSILADSDDAYIVQQQVNGDNYRVVVFRGEVKVVYRREVAFVVGDGVRTVDELIEARNAQQLKHAPCNVEYAVTESTYNVNSKTVLDRGQKVEVRYSANSHTGCDAVHVPVDDVHPHNLKRWAGVNDALGLAYSGMDYMTEDIGTTDGYISDVYPNPGMEGVKFGLGRPLGKEEAITWFPLGPANRRTTSEVPCAEDMVRGEPEGLYIALRYGKCTCEGHTKNWWDPKMYYHPSIKKNKKQKQHLHQIYQQQQQQQQQHEKFGTPLYEPEHRYLGTHSGENTMATTNVLNAERTPWWKVELFVRHPAGIQSGCPNFNQLVANLLNGTDYATKRFSNLYGLQSEHMGANLNAYIRKNRTHMKPKHGVVSTECQNDPWLACGEQTVIAFLEKQVTALLNEGAYDSDPMASSKYIKHVRIRDWWANMNMPGDYNKYHNHSNSAFHHPLDQNKVDENGTPRKLQFETLSGVWYPPIPKGQEILSPNATLFFSNRKFSGSQTAVPWPSTPTRVREYERGVFRRDVAAHIPRDSIILFPAWLEHAVPKNTKNNARFSIAFNLFVDVHEVPVGIKRYPEKSVGQNGKARNWAVSLFDTAHLVARSALRPQHDDEDKRLQMPATIDERHRLPGGTPEELVAKDVAEITQTLASQSLQQRVTTLQHAVAKIQTGTSPIQRDLYQSMLQEVSENTCSTTVYVVNMLEDL